MARKSRPAETQIQFGAPDVADGPLADAARQQTVCQVGNGVFQTEVVVGDLAKVFAARLALDEMNSPLPSNNVPAAQQPPPTAAVAGSGGSSGAGDQGNTFDWWYCVDAQTAEPSTNTNGHGPWLYIVSSVFHGKDGGGYQNTVKELYAGQFHDFDRGRYPGFLADDPKMRAHATCWPYDSQEQAMKKQQQARPYYDDLGTRVDSDWRP